MFSLKKSYSFQSPLSKEEYIIYHWNEGPLSPPLPASNLHIKGFFLETNTSPTEKLKLCTELDIMFIRLHFLIFIRYFIWELQCIAC